MATKKKKIRLNANRDVLCGSGINFFNTRKEAIDYY